MASCHAGLLITRYQVRGSGRTSYRMAKGRDAIQPVCELGEMVMFSPPKTNACAKASKWKDKRELGIFLGSVLRSNEPIIGMSTGVFAAAHFDRRPADERWSRDFAAKVQGTPREPKPAPGKHRIPSFVPWHVHGIANTARDPESLEPPSGHDMIASVLRTFKIKKTDIMDHGPKDGCPGGRAAMADTGAKNHLDSCRQRMEELLKASPEGQERLDAAVHRMTRAIAEEGQIIIAA